MQPITSYQEGMELTLTVRDLAVTLALCDEHGRELSTAGWRSILELLHGWGWRPLRRDD